MSARSVFELILRRRFYVLSVIAGLSVFFALQLPNLHIDPDTESFVPNAHPVRQFWKQTKERFAVGKDIFVGIQADGPDGVFTPEILAGLARLTEGIEKLDTVAAGDVRSIANSEAILGSEEGLEIEAFYETAPRDRSEALAIRKKVFDNDVYLDRLVSRDGSIAAIIVQAHDRYEADSPYAHPVEVFKEVVEYVNDNPIPGTRFLFAGTTAVESAYGRQIAEDLAKLIPIALMVVVFVLFLCFPPHAFGNFLLRTLAVFAIAALWKVISGSAAAWDSVALGALTLSMLSLRGVLLPALVVITSVTWMWGIQALMGLPIYITGTLIPPILLAIGCADGIHVIERYFGAAGSGQDKERLIIDTMVELWRPVILTSVTTAIGFGALMFGRMTIYQVFGFTTAVGIIVAMVMSLTLLPALLSILPLPLRTGRAARSALLPRILVRSGAMVGANAKTVLAAGAVLSVLLAVAASGLRLDYSWVESLTPGTPVLESDRVLRERHGGTMPMDIVVSTDQAGGIKDPALLRAIDETLDELSKHPHVGDTRSIAEYIKRMNQAMHADDVRELRIPGDRELVAQYLLFYSMSGDPAEFDDMVDYEYRGAHLGVLMRSDWLSDMNSVIERTEELLDRNVRSLGAEAQITGSVMIMKTIFEMILYSQIASLSAAAILVFFFLLLLFRSFADALTAMLPPAFTALATFACMALAGKPLGPNEAMISAIAMGIGIDYSIHFMARLRLLMAEGLGTEDAIAGTMSSTGRAILFNAVVVVAGFAVLALSQSPSNAIFGLLVAANMAVCCFAALFLLPALLTVRTRRRSSAVAG